MCRTTGIRAIWLALLLTLSACSGLSIPPATTPVSTSGGSPTVTPVLNTPAVDMGITPTGSAPTLPPPIVSTSPVSITSQGLRLEFDSQLGTTWEAGEASSLFDGPRHRFIELTGYSHYSSGNDARILIIPIDEYKQAGPFVTERLDQLSRVLAQQPAALPDELQYLPKVNAANILHARPLYLSFANGSGVRYLTTFTHEASPITNQGLLYVYQGISADGRYLVAGLFSVSSTDLPDEDYDLPPDVDYDTYIDQLESQMAITNSALFEPDLALLDHMLQSMTIEQ